MSWKQKFKKYKSFLGPKVLKLILLSVSTGLLWFLIESSFIFILQGFIYSLGITDKDKLILPSWYPTSTMGTLLILLVFGFVRTIGSYLNTYLSQRVEQAFLRTQRHRLLSFIFNNFQKISPNEGISLFTEIVKSASQFIFYLSQLSIHLTTSICLFCIGFFMAPKEMTVGVLILAIFLYPIRILSRKVTKYGEGIVKEWEKINKTILFGIKNYFFIKLHGLIEKEIGNGGDSLKNYEGHFKRYSHLSSFMGAFPQFLGIIVICILTFLGLKVFNTPGIKLLSFFYIFIRMIQAASSSSITFSFLKLGVPGIKKLYNWYELGEEYQKMKLLSPPVKEEVKNSLNNNGIEIRVKDLNFSYDNNPVISNLSFLVQKGNPLLIKGKSGTGKSTILSLLTGILTPSSGSITINNYPLFEVGSHLPKMLGYVGPDPYIFEGTVRDNLLYGNDLDICEEEIWNTLNLVYLSDSISSLDFKLHEYTQLSTGQKQRMALARALLRRSKILILDEATANLDKQTEQKVIDSLELIKDKTTIIIISHKNTFDHFATNKLELGL